jgi:hypothetical protein
MCFLFEILKRFFNLHLSMENKQGFVLLGTLIVITVLSALLGAFYLSSKMALASTRLSEQSTSGFYSAEAGLNIRAEEIRQTFEGFNRPSGTSPNDVKPCEGTNLGSGDFRCKSYELNGVEVFTFVKEKVGNPLILTIPPGEIFHDFNAQEYRYSVESFAKDREGKVNAILELKFKSRLIPIFQFAAFFNKDLEILPGQPMTLAGPVYANGDLYLNTNASLDILGQVTTAGNVYRGRKNDGSCLSKPVNIFDPLNPKVLVPTCSSRTLIKKEDVAGWNGMIKMNIEPLTVPEPEVFDPLPGSPYWDKAELRLVLNLNSSNNPDTTYASTGVEVREPNDQVDVAKTSNLSACSGTIAGLAVGNTASFYNNREAKTIRMLEVDMEALFNCVGQYNLFGPGVDLDDDTDGGLVIYLTVKGPNSNDPANPYGVRLRNSAKLKPSASGYAKPIGVSIISDQAVYTLGNYNSVDKIPAAIMTDSFNILSNAWVDTNSSWTKRIPSNTIVNTAVIAGTDSTGGIDGINGQGGSYNGGLENYPRMHEQWGSGPKTLTYLGSFISLNKPHHVKGSWAYGSPQYTAPNRDWKYDTDFNVMEKLPPMTPQVIYLKQELFLREFQHNN